MVIKRIYFDTSMSLSFGGLSEMMKKSKLDIGTIESGEFVVFVNRKQTAFKLLCGPSLLVYHNNGGRRFPITAITQMPRFFDGSKIDFSAAVDRAVRENMKVMGEVSH